MGTRTRQRQGFAERYPGLNPATYAALVAWWDQNDARGYGTTARWNDLSGLKNDLVQATAGNQPSIVGTAGGIAGRVRSFDGTDDFMAQEILATASTGTFQLATVAAGAMIYSSALDLTPYLGKFIRVKDTGGKYAWGYIKAACGGEALGSDLFDAGAGVFTSGTYSWLIFGTNDIANDTNTLKITYVDNVSGAYLYLKDAADLTADPTVGTLYKLTLATKVNAGSVVNVIVSYVEGTTSTLITQTTMTAKEFYFNARHATNCYLYTPNMEAGEIIWLDNLVFKPVTDLPVTGVTIVSTLGGATQSWTGQESGFLPNAISTVEVLEPDFNITGAMTVLAWLKPDDGQPAAAQSILSKWDTTAHEAYDFLLLTTGKLKAVLTHDGATEWDHTTDAAVYANGTQSAFSFIGFVFDGAGNIDVFSAGAEVASTATGTPKNTIMDTAAVFAIGKNVDGSPFAGSQALQMIFSRALSAAEIQRIYLRTAPFYGNL